MLATVALLKQPQLRLVERARSDERRALRALSDWGLQYSSRVHSDIDRWLLWLEVGASLQYFEGLGPLRVQIEQGIQKLRFTASIGIASTFEASALFALHGAVPPAPNREEIVRHASKFPMLALAVEGRILEQLKATGIVTVGDVLAIPQQRWREDLAAESRMMLHGFWVKLQMLDDIEPVSGMRGGMTLRTLFKASKGCCFPCGVCCRNSKDICGAETLRFKRWTSNRGIVMKSTRLSRCTPGSLNTGLKRVSCPLTGTARAYARKAAVTELRVAARNFSNAPEKYSLQGDFFDYLELG